MKDFSSLPTEQANPASRDLDRLPLKKLISLMNREDARPAQAVRRVMPDIARAVGLIVGALKKGGRLFLVGAGTSGRLCVMEAAECPPTFNTPPEWVQALMAGDKAAVFRSREGAEDNALEAERRIRRKLKAGDVTVGVAASGVTPFVLSALMETRRRRGHTVLVTCNPNAGQRSLAEVVIAPAVGPEILAGSTRLKAGTACKMVLNMLTTLSMVRLGKVYRHWMVDLQPKSLKLKARGTRLIQLLGRVSEKEAANYLKKARGRVKTAIVMARNGISRLEAVSRLRRRGGFLHKVLK
ncbi:MAG TPA: N-acetylmuramic acid 6-phosphate etherase [Elusimicrobiota bacterium]|nr:N-acetylmuramic acid 6-phosphate etherase [Elusimicrobiota bacterium]